MCIYTKKGDKGTTTLLDGKTVSKASAIPNAIGTMDELNANIGMAKALLKDSQGDNSNNDDGKLNDIQEDLFRIGSCLAGNTESIDNLEDSIKLFEETIDELTERLPKLKNFILPNGSQVGSQFHICRTICRRAERTVVEVEENKTILKYLNRLSDLLFMYARASNYYMDEEETIWKDK